MPRPPIISLDIVGDREVSRILSRIAPKEARNLIRATVGGIAGRIRDGAKRRVSVDDGDLKKGIYVKREKSHPDRPVSSVRFKKSAFYWRFVEHGTERGNMLDARPFLAPARHEVTSNLNNIMREEFQKKLNARINRILRQQAR